jgi:hypothetical protein
MRTAIHQHGGLLRNNRYVVQMPVRPTYKGLVAGIRGRAANALGNLDGLGDLAQTAERFGFPLNSLDDRETLSVLCRLTGIPARTIQTIERKTNFLAVDNPGGGSVEPVTMTFTEVQDGMIIRYIENWMNEVQNPDTGVTAYREDIARDIKVFTYDRNNDKSLEATLVGCWPTTRPEIQYTDETNDEMVTISVSFSVKKVKYKQYKGRGL